MDVGVEGPFSCSSSLPSADVGDTSGYFHLSPISMTETPSSQSASTRTETRLHSGISYVFLCRLIYVTYLFHVRELDLARHHVGLEQVAAILHGLEHRINTSFMSLWTVRAQLLA